VILFSASSQIVWYGRFPPQPFLIHHSTAVLTLHTIWPDLCQVNYKEIQLYVLNQQCTNPGSQIAMTIGFLTEAPNIWGFWVWNLLLMLPSWRLEFWGRFQLCRKFVQSCRQALHDSVNASPSGCGASLSSVLPCTSLLSFIQSVYMNIFSDNHAITLATLRCFGLVDIVQKKDEDERKSS